MKKIIFMIMTMTWVLSASEGQQNITYAKVLEVLEVMGYDYLKVEQNGTERWVAIAKAPVKTGDTIGYDTKTVMKNFKSKTLNRTFAEIVFANEVYLPSRPGSLKDELMQQPPEKKSAVKPAADFVDKAFYTVEELFRYRKNLEGKKVSVKAKVRKVSHKIMKRDWVHLEDGTGSETDHTEDIVFTSEDTSVKAGDTVVASGTIVIDKDFGYGYFYPVLGEKASFDLQ